jgi:alpha-galactosidase
VDGKGYYLAIFNRGESPLDIDLGWNEVGLGLGKAYHLRDLWERRDLGSATSLKLTLPPHACVLYRISE